MNKPMVHGASKLCLFVQFTLVFVMTSTGLLAAPHFGEAFTYRQPDGEAFQVHLYGDEFFAYQETSDGYLIVRDENNGFFCYAKVTPNGSDIISTGVRVGQAKPAGLKPRQRLSGGKAMLKSLGNRNLFGVDDKGRRNHGKKLKAGKGGEILNVPIDETTVQSAPADGSSTGTGPVVLPAPPNRPAPSRLVGLVLLASFPDRPADITKTVSQIDDYCNAETYTADNNATSIYGYFKIQSNGKLSYRNNVTAWFTAANPRSYYTDETIPYGRRAMELINEGLTILKAKGFDFTQCDRDNNGILDGVSCFYAGARTNSWGEAIWPHQSVSSWVGLTGTGLTLDTFSYQITDMPASLPIGTFCHEIGHLICDFPDLYPQPDGSRVNAANLGAFSLMANGGSTHPRNVDPYLKIHAGWADVVDITSTSHQLCAVQQDRNFFYRYRNPARTAEYFLFEVRGKAGYEGAWGGAGATNPANGLVIYHALQTGSNTHSSIYTADAVTNYTTPYELMVVESTPSAAAPWYDDPNPTANDAFSSTGVSAISDSTTPSDLKFWAAGGRTLASGANIHTISAAGETMRFIVGAGALPATAATNVTATQFQTNVDFGENAANQTFSVFNAGGGTLTYNISDDVTWLACTPDSGTATTEADLITVTYTTNALAAGTHTATITIDGGADGIKTIGVTLTVNPRPTLAAVPGSLAVAGVIGTSGSNATFNLRNTGGGTASYTISKTQPWLTLGRTNGSIANEQDLVTAAFDATSLTPGVYTDTITITAAEATNSPLTIPVSYTVDGYEMILAAPNGGETWFVNKTHAITWTSSLGGMVKIELFKGGVLNSIIAASTPNTHSYDWTVPGTLTFASDYQIKVTSIESPTVSDLSFTNFTIAEDLLSLALDTPSLMWSTSTDAWFPTTTVANTHDGEDAAESANIGRDQTTTMETTIVGPGTMTFWWKVSSEPGYDFLRFYLNGVEQTGSLARISGPTVAWAQKTVTIAAGSNVVKWAYTKDGNTDAGSDTAWVDQVVYTPSPQPEIAVEQPLNTGLTDGFSTIDFGSVNTGSSTPLTFTIKNVGTANLTGLALAKTGTHSADYTLGALSTTNLAPNASTTFTATFAPVASGPRTAAIQIASNDVNENPFDIKLTGNGIGPGSLAVTGAGGLTSSGAYAGPFTPSSIDYTLSNPGNTSINWTAAKTQSWVSLSAATGTLAAGATTTVTASINAGANTLGVGSYSDTVTFTNTTSGTGDTTRAVALSVNPIAAAVSLSDLLQTYNRSPKPVTVTTTPGGLAHSVTYAGSGTVPTNAGTYAVVATITQANYSGSASGSLTIQKAAQTITFGALSPMVDTAAPFALGGTTSSGLTIAYSSSNTAVATVTGNTVTVVGLGSSTITAAQAGDANYNAATSVPQTLTVVRANPLAVTGGPYKVFIGQSLILNGSASQPSGGQTISAHEWDLNITDNGGAFDMNVSGATTTAISVSDLMGLWGMREGLNTIQLKITDTANKTSIVSTTVELVLSLAWDANGTGAGQTNGAGAWLGSNLWWDGKANTDWVSGSNAVFGGLNTTGGAVTLASPTAVNQIIFNQHTGTYTLGAAAQSLTLNGGIDKTVASSAVSIISPITLGAAQTWSNHSSGTLTVTGVIGGSGGITKAGTGTVILNAAQDANDYTGNTKVTAGILQLGTVLSNANNMPGGMTGSSGVAQSNLELNGGTVSIWQDMTRTLGTGPTQFQITGGRSGFTNKQSNNTAGNLTIGNNASNEIVWGSDYFKPSTFVMQDAAANPGTAVFNLANNIDLNGATRTIEVGASTATLSQIIRNSNGAAGVIKEGRGRLVLSNSANSWNGNTTVSDGLLHLGAANLTNIGGGSGRNITVAAGAGIGFNTLSNAILSRIVETTAEISVMTGSTSNAFDFSSSAGATLSNAFLGTYSSNGTKAELAGVITPGGGSYRLGAPGGLNNGTLGITQASLLSGSNGLIIGGSRVVIVGTHTFTGDTTLRDGAILGLSGLDTDAGAAKNNSFALQNSVLDLGAPSATGQVFLEAGSAGGILGLTTALNGATTSATFGGLKGSKDLNSAFRFTNAGSQTSGQAATAISGFTLNVGAGNTVTYSGAIGGFGVGAGGGLYGNSTLTKTGLGTQILGGASTYTGLTAITAGKLIITGDQSLATGDVSVEANATLGGTGIIGGNTTIAATGKLEFDLSAAAASHNKLELATGKALTFSGASVITITSSGGAQVGTYTLLTAPGGINGVDPATLKLPVGWAATVSIVGNDLVLNVTSVGSLAVDHFAISSIASPQTIGSPITGITLTAQNASNQTATSFAGTVAFGGTAGITGTSASFVNGVLSGLSVTPTAAGSNLTFTVNDGSSHTGSVTFSVETLYAGWTRQIFANAFTVTTSTANPDGDGLNNVQEFAFGTDPTLPTLPPLAFAMDGNITTPGAPRLMNFSASTTPDYRAVFVRRKDYVIAGLTYAVAFSADLNLWTTSATAPTRLTNANSTGDLDAVSVPFPGTVPLSGGGNAAPKFFRVSVD